MLHALLSRQSTACLQFEVDSVVAKVIRQRPHRIREEIEATSYVPWVPKSLHAKQDLDPFSRFRTARPRGRLTDAEIIDRNSPHLMHSKSQ